MFYSSDITPDFQTQLELEELYNKNQTLPRLRKEFNIPMIQEEAVAAELPVPFVVDLLAQMVLHKRAAPSTLVGILHHHVHPEGSPKGYQPSQEELQRCADMVAASIERGFVFWDDTSQMVVIRIDVAQEVYDDLARYQYPLPLVIQPKKVTHNHETGYHSPGSRHGSLILRSAGHEYDICLDHINRVNAMKLSVNQDIVALIQNKWRHLDKRKEGETQAEYRQRVQAFERYTTSSKDVLQHLAMLGNEFYLTHRYDKRGRCYAQGYHVSTQGNSWNKACIEFAEKELVTNGTI